jgi:hypothetical protein
MNLSITNIIEQAIAALLVTAIGFAWRRMSLRWLKGHNSPVKQNGAYQMTSIKILKGAFGAIPYLLAFWCVFMLLEPLLSATTPPTRWDVFGICFWTFWACMLFLRLLAGKDWPFKKE